jgi:hypothetical protein
VEFFLEDIELSPLLTNGATDPNIGIERLARNFRRLLGSYSKELRQIAQSRIQREAANFVHHNSAYVSEAVINWFDTSTGRHILRLPSDTTETEQKAAAEERLNKFLEGLQEPESSDENQIPPLLEEEEAFDTDYDEEVINNALIQVKNFLESGSPFENLRKGLRTFVLPQKNKEQHTADHFHHKTDVKSPTLPEQYSRQPEVVTSTYISRTDDQGQYIMFFMFTIATIAFLPPPSTTTIFYVMETAGL